MSISISGSSYVNSAATQSLASSSEALASGSRINSAADDAAGLQISNRLTSEIDGSAQAFANGMSGISVTQTIDGALSGITNDVQALRELAVQSGNGIYTANDRQALQKQADELMANIQNTIDNTNFAGQSLLTQDGQMDFQVGTQGADIVGVTTYNLNNSLGASGLTGINISDPATLGAALDAIDTTLNNLGTMQAETGATQNAFSSRVDALLQGQEAASASRSRITDTDFAAAVSEQIISRIQEQSSLTVQAQANVDSKRALSLLTS